MPGWFKIGADVDAKWRGKPPQMLATDIPTWWKFLEGPRAPKYKRLYYNIAMTTVDPTDVQGPPSLVDMWLYNVSKRVDVIGELEDEMHIIEVTDRAGIRTFGQATLYAMLFDYTEPFGPVTGRPMIVCNYADPDIQWACQLSQIELIELNPIAIQSLIAEVFPPK